MLKRLSPLAAVLLLTACQRSPAPPAPAPAPPAATAPTPTPPPAVADRSAEVAGISAERERIEAKRESLAKQEISFATARPQLKQKWDKLHAYREDGKVVRIKTYPYPTISKRTEEFYFKDGALILAFIEDEGLGQQGRDEARKGKTYWFAGSTLIKEENSTGEAEASTPADDGARLQQEAKEYLELVAASKP